MTPTKACKKTLTQRMYEWRKKGKFHSTKVSYTKTHRKITRYLSRVTIRAWKDATDDLKAPMNNAAKPAMFQPASLNIYYGRNLPSNMPFLQRTSYGTGSGSISIGLNPKTMKIHSFTSDITILANEVSNLLKGKNKIWKQKLEEHPFNFVGVKVYYSYRRKNGELIRKNTAYHVDVTYNHKTRQPMRNNSQIPGTPVALLTCGSPKNLWFRRHKSSKEYDPESLLHFQQNHGSIVVLDGRDEEPDQDGFHWRHMSNMGMDATGITYTFSFRSVQHQLAVAPNGCLIKPPSLSPLKELAFEMGAVEFDDDHYKASKKELKKRMAEFLKQINT